MSGISISNPFKDLDQPVVIRPSNSPGPQGPAAPELKIQYSIDAISWHDVPAENDMYVRFSTNNGGSWGEALLISNLAGSVIGPESSVDGNIAVFDGATGKVIKDAGFEPIMGPDVSINGDIPIFDGITGKVIKDSGFTPEQFTIGPESSTSGNVAIFDGTTGKALKDDGITSNVWDVIIEDQKPQNTDGGTFASGAWQTRDLNTLVFNHNSLASLSNNRFTLPAGTYCIDWDAPAYRVNRHKTALYNYSSSTIVAYGTSELSSESGATMNRSVGTKVVTISSSTSFTIRHICQSSYNNTGFGCATNFGTEVYTRVRIKKIA
jgi:hypothetical protein